MLSSYLPVLIMMILGTVVASGMVIGSYLLGPKKPTKYKQSAYECGMTPVGSARERFPIKFYLIAMLFIIFDIETIFLYPWAVIFRNNQPNVQYFDNVTQTVQVMNTGERAIKLFNLGEMAVFVGILFVGYFYILGKGALDWDEGQAEDAPQKDKRIFVPRPPIRFGNESSGPVRLPAEGNRAARDAETASVSGGTGT